jgi:hypothetical protein
MGGRDKHPYQTCGDPDCPLPYCRIYKEGTASGRGAGFAAGEASGRADGYAEGYSDGATSAGE